MKRRTFVRSAAIGAFGLSFAPNINASPLTLKNDARQWFRSLTEAVSARRRSAALYSAGSFRSLMASLQPQFAAQGYYRENSAAYFYGEQEQYCLYTLELRRAASALNDVIAPVLKLDANGEWKHVKTLNSYQLEALSLAVNAPALRAAATPLHEVLLPVNTRTEVTISTRLQGSKAKTGICISDRSKVIFSETFDSAHCLTFSEV